jgi:hypothetical protein
MPAIEDLLAPLDFPRQSLYNLARAGRNLVSGDATLDDLRRAAPGALGLGAGFLGGPLLGLGVAGALQGLGGSIDPEAYAAPTPADVVQSRGGDTESFLQVALANLATDPVNIVGGLGTYRLGRGLLAEGAAARAPITAQMPSVVSAGPRSHLARELGPDIAATMPRGPGPPVVAAPETFGTPGYYTGTQAALEADAARAVAAEERAARLAFLDQPPPGAVAPGPAGLPFTPQNPGGGALTAGARPQRYAGATAPAPGTLPPEAAELPALMAMERDMVRDLAARGDPTMAMGRPELFGAQQTLANDIIRGQSALAEARMAQAASAYEPGLAGWMTAPGGVELSAGEFLAPEARGLMNRFANQGAAVERLGTPYSPFGRAGPLLDLPTASPLDSEALMEAADALRLNARTLVPPVAGPFGEVGEAGVSRAITRLLYGHLEPERLQPLLRGLENLGVPFNPEALTGAYRQALEGQLGLLGGQYMEGVMGVTSPARQQAAQARLARLLGGEQAATPLLAQLEALAPTLPQHGPVSRPVKQAGQELLKQAVFSRLGYL